MVGIVAKFVNRHLNQHAESPFCRLIYYLERLYPSSGWKYFDEFWEGDPSKLIAQDSPNLEDLLTLVDISVAAGWPNFGIYPSSATDGAERSLINPYYALQGPMPSAFFGPDRVRLLNLMILTLIVSMGGTRCAFHEQLASVMKPGDTVLTFNYDTLIDEALSAAGKLTDAGYGVDFAGIIKEKDRTNDYSFGGAEYGVIAQHQESPVELIKLHGSLNWVKCAVCESTYLDLGAEELPFMARQRLYFEWLIKHLAESDENPVMCDWLLEADAVAEHFDCIRCGALRLRRVIIPPVIQKSFTKNIFLLQWYRAGKSLTRRPHKGTTDDYDIVVVGYSLPQSDYYSRLLFSFASEPSSITVVSPSGSRVEAFQNVFGGLLIPCHFSPDEFLKSL